MSHWRVAQHYGYGAGRIPIQPEPHRAARLSLAAGFADVSADLASGGPLDMARRILGQSPAILLGLMLIATFVVTLGRDYSDESPVEVVLFESVPPPAELPPEPIPEPVLAEVLPEPAPAPPPPATQLVERPKPPPAPPPVERRPAPKPPAMPQIARVEPAPAPPPPRRVERAPQRPPPPPSARPRVALAALAPVQQAETSRAPRRTERLAAAARPTRSSTPRLDAPAAPDIAPESPPPPRGFRVAAASGAAPTRRPLTLPGMAPAPRGLDAPKTSAPTRSRIDAPRPSRSARLNVTPTLSEAPASLPGERGARSAAPHRASRSAPTPSPRRAPRPTAALARTPDARPAVSVPSITRHTRPAAPAPQGASGSRPGLAGVPLGELMACVSDREEDRLKQAVVAAVTTQGECVSRAGTYRFVETKNLNSFLMWIDRASNRSVGDRCDELRYALECLQSASHRAAR